MINDFYIDNSLDECEILKIKKDDKWLYIGSKYNMKKEINLIQENIKKISSLKYIVAFGGANGSWLEDIDKITTGKEILIVEPKLSLYKALVGKKYNVQNNIVKVVCMEDDNFYENMLSAVNKSIFEVLVFANYDMVYAKEFKIFIDKVMAMITDKKVGENTSKLYAETWFESYLKNILHIFNAELVDSYKNSFKNKPAIIVSAGPSLDKNLKYLKENEEKFIIITGGRTLVTLKNEGIKADFTCVIDSSEAMYNVFKPALDMDVPLLFNEETSEKIVNEYNGKKIFFDTREFANADKEILGFNSEKLFQGGSVVHPCASFAKLLGCDPIVFIGQDLAYTDNKLHSDNSVVNNENNEIINTETYVKGVVEERVLTNYDLNIFRERLEMIIKLYRETTFINCTEGGAHIEGTEVKKLKDFISECNQVIDKSSIGKYDKINISKENVKNKLNSIYIDIDELIGLCNDAKKINNNLIDLYLKSPGKYNKALDRLDEIDKKINDKNAALHLFETLMEPVNYDLSIKFGENSEEHKSIFDKIKAVSEKGKYLNDEFIRIFNFGKPLIKECIRNLEELQ